MNVDIDQLLEATIQDALEATIASVQPVLAEWLKHFRFAHLPAHLRRASMQFADVACRVAMSSCNVQTLVSLQKLLESKDAAVRALLP